MSLSVTAPRFSAADYVSLVKPGITRMVIFTTFGGMLVVPGPTDLVMATLTVLGMVLVVGGANALNCYLERDTDALMTRTADRPLPAGRMAPPSALRFGLLTSGAALPILALGASLQAALLAGLALFAYVLVYTPLKRRSPVSTLVGAFPGALPPLIGYVAKAGEIGAPGVLLFAILFLWQMPHFYAIGLFRKDEYAAAGLQIVSVVYGEKATRIQMARYSTALVAVSLLMGPMAGAGPIYLIGAALFGLAFLALNVYGALARELADSWARRVFHASLIYLAGVVVLLVVDAWVGAA